MRQIEVLTFHTNHLVAVLGTAVALMLFLYGTLLLLAVFHTAARASAEQEIERTEARISTLEAEYFAGARGVTPERAAELGFVKPVASHTVSARAGSHALTLEHVRTVSGQGL